MAAYEVFTNAGSAVVVTGGTGAVAGGTVETWTVTAVNCPTAVAGVAQFRVVDIADTSVQPEIMLVTVGAGAGSATWTVTRGAESTTPVAHVAGFTVVPVYTQGVMAALTQAPNNLSDLLSAATARTNLGLGTAAVQPSTAFDASGAATSAQAAAATDATNKVATETTRATNAEALALAKASNLSDLANAATARTNLGLGTAAVAAVDATAADIAPLGAQSAGATGKVADAGHVHPVATPQPVDHGLLAWSFDPASSTTGGPLPTAALLNLVKVWVPPGTATNVCINITSGGTLTSLQCFAGLFNAAGTLLSATADQSVAWASTGFKTMVLTAAQTVTIGGYYYVGFFYNGGVAPSLSRGGNTTASNVNLTAVNSRFGTGSAGLTTAMPGTTGTVAAATQAWWVGVS